MTTLPDCPNECHVAAALLHKRELLNGCRGLLAPALFREPVFREIVGLSLRGATDAHDIETRLRACGQWSDAQLDDELRGLADMALVLDRSQAAVLGQVELV